MQLETRRFTKVDGPGGALRTTSGPSDKEA